MAKAKKILPIITLSTRTGDVAKAMIPGACYLANSAREQGLGAPKVTAKSISITLHEDHPLVQAGLYEANSRVVTPTPVDVVYYIAHNVDRGLKVGDRMVASEDADFVIDLSASGTKVISPSKVGPRNGARGDRSEETKKAKTQPQRAAQKREANQRQAIRLRNAALTRAGRPAMTADDTEIYLRSLGL